MWDCASGCSSIVHWQKCQERQEELAPTPPLTPRNRSASGPGARPEVRDTVKDVMFRFHIPRTCPVVMGWKGWLRQAVLSNCCWVILSESLGAHWSVGSLQSRTPLSKKIQELFCGLWGTVHVALECPLTFLRSKHHHACHGSCWERWPEALDLCWMRCQPLPLGCWDEVKWRCWRNGMAKPEP